MTIDELREDLEAIRTYAQIGDLSQIIERVDQALEALNQDRILTTTEAAALLGVRSVNTLKLLVRRCGVPYERHGNRMMIPVSSLQQLQVTPELRGIRASDQAHDATEALGASLSDAQLAELAQARPGMLPWQKQVEETK